MSCFIIAEAGVNHNGNPDLALRLVDAAAAAGADAVKFQTFRTDQVVTKGTEKADYQRSFTGDGDQYDMIRALELDEHAHELIAERCVQQNIEFMSTPFDAWATDLLLRLGMRRIKIASGELTHRPFIEDLARRGLPLILSTGMASLDEVRRSVGWLRDCHTGLHRPDWLTLLHCTSNYPALPRDVNLLAMQSLGRELGVPIGYSDHTLGIEVSVAAVALGATVIEKHFTLDRSLPGPDHQASLDPDQLAALVRATRSVESALGDGIKQPTTSELPVRALVRRSAFTSQSLPAGSPINANTVSFLRPGNGIGPEHWNELQVRKTVRALPAGYRLSWQDLT
jgi:N,N'-diacetyllegionaminate synthase